LATAVEIGLVQKRIELPLEAGAILEEGDQIPGGSLEEPEFLAGIARALRQQSRKDDPSVLPEHCQGRVRGIFAQL